MIERGFVDALLNTLYKMYGEHAVVVRPNDQYTLGIPDLLCWRKSDRALAIEAKQINPLMPDATKKGRRRGMMLHHEFTGPQISMLRQLDQVGVEAFGLVRASQDTAYRIHPGNLPMTGNFTFDEMVNIGVPIYRTGGMWRFWDVPSTRHRDDPVHGDLGQLVGGLSADLGSPGDHDRDAGAGQEPAPDQGRVRQRRMRVRRD